MRHLPTSRYPTGKPFRSPGQWGDRCIATVTFGDSGRIDLMWAPAPSRRAGALGGRHRRTGPADTVYIAPPEAREGTCGGWGAELKTLGYSRVEIRWKVGTSSGWRW